MQKEDTSWFASWFNSPYYHLLYKDRDYTEGGIFMQSLTAYLKLKQNAKILDLACGKGRHSKFLATLGYRVTGADLSPLSIAEAKKSETKNLSFEIHDMCTPYPDKFDAIFNLFTSFGYFETEKDNINTVIAIKEALKEDGFGVIDFLNTNYVVKNLVKTEDKHVAGINFKIQREIKDGYIYKHINFTAENQEYSFTEKVKALTLQDFKTYFEEAKVNLYTTFGNYKLEPFDSKQSPRLILIFKK
ncbi:class I SAM-dependent methyltransferase [Patiriisocius sp. Uisw_017]|jgi:SAM-dependent methyltransferase|uniref:class I SAM-dependent methyltransferase n=1 Tax=Patiriisocius sp. Uisw_017 TaxID=3230968 RepID=UPI0039EB547C